MALYKYYITMTLSFITMFAIAQSVNDQLDLALKGNEWKYIDDALSKGADINYQNEDGMTALMWAAENNSGFFYLKLLIFESNKNLKNISGHTAMEIANLSKSKGVISFVKNLERNLIFYIKAAGTGPGTRLISVN